MTSNTSELPCDHYEYEYKSNCNMFGKLKKLFKADDTSTYTCDELKQLFYACVKYKEDPKRNLECLVKLKEYENELVKKRIDSIKQNDVWTYRQGVPPTDWNAPLPDWAQERINNSYWFKNNKNKE